MYFTQLYPYNIPKKYIERGKVQQLDIVESDFGNGHFKVALLLLQPDSKIAEHQHIEDQEYYINLRDSSISICNVGESHSLENTSKTEELRVISIKIAKNLKTLEKSYSPHDVSKKYIERGKVQQFDIVESDFENGHFKVALLLLQPNSKIAEHHHKSNEQEYYVNLRDLSINLCSIGASHYLENISKDEALSILSIKTTKKIKNSEKS